MPLKVDAASDTWRETICLSLFIVRDVFPSFRLAFLRVTTVPQQNTFTNAIRTQLPAVFSQSEPDACDLGTTKETISQLHLPHSIRC